MDAQFSVQTEYADRLVAGMDTAVCNMPSDYYVDIDGKPTLVMQPFARWLRTLSTTLAKNTGSRGELLHHAEWVITTEPETVALLGNVHDCEDCRKGVTTALEYMAEHPGVEMLVGHLYWAGARPT